MSRQLPLHDGPGPSRSFVLAATPPRQTSRPLRVVFYADPRSAASPGGGEIQLHQTAESMRRLGVDVRVFDRSHDELYACDWLHIFGTIPEGLSLARAAKQRDVRVALSTIAWYDPWVSWRLEGTSWRKFRGVAGWSMRRLAPRVPSWRRELMQLCDLLLPNSRAEARQLVQLFGVSWSKIAVAPNGVDERFAHADAELFERQFGLRNFVLVPGRIEPRKNQLHVLRALWGSGMPVVVLGDPHPDHGAYLQKCRDEADSGVTFIRRLNHDSPLLASAYAASRVVVLASWFETPGLAAMEGALAGAEIVITERGSAREYFQNLVLYVPPDDAGRIRAAVREAFDRPRQCELRELVRRQFTWERAASQTLNAYHSIRDGMVRDATESPLGTAKKQLLQIRPTELASPRYRYAKWRYRVLFRLLDAVCAAPFRWFRSRARRVWAEPQSILVVQLDHIGDAVLSTPMLRCLKERFPDAAIDVLASQSNRQIFQANRWVNRVHVSDRNWHTRRPGKPSWLSEVLRLARFLRTYRYDLAIDPRGDFLVALVIWLAAIPRRVGWSCGGGGFLLTDVAQWDVRRHELEARRTLLLLLGIPSHAEQFQPEVSPGWEDHYVARELMQSVPSIRPPITLIHVGAGTPAKRWPIAHWQSLVAGLLDDPGGSIILVGESGDRTRADQIASSSAAVLNWAGRLTLMQFAALLGEVDVFIGCDSGPAHIAAARGVPSVVLFSGTNRPECWRPVGPCVRVLRHAVSCAPCHCKQCPVPGHPCMSAISPRDVLIAARDVMKTFEPVRRFGHGDANGSFLPARVGRWLH